MNERWIALLVAGACLVVPAAAQAESSPDAAIATLQSANPDVLADSRPVSLADQTIAPSLTAADLSSPDYVSQNSGAQVSIPAAAQSAMQLETRWGPLQIQPVNVDPGASAATLAGSDTVVYAGTSPGADTAVRATPLGLSTYTQIRTASAPPSYSWRLSLAGGLHLMQLQDGSIAVLADTTTMTPANTDTAWAQVQSGSQPAEQPVAVADPPSTAAADAVPSPADDSSASLQTATSALADAGQQTDGYLLADIAVPTATDADGHSVPVALSVKDDTITMTLNLSGADIAFPVLADPDYNDCAHTSPCGTYDQNSAIAYAKKWTSGRNPAYQAFGNDCTNFMSQILRAGGMQFMREYAHGQGSWWMRNILPSGHIPVWDSTDSWRLADVLPRHLSEYGLAHWVSDPRPGDLLIYNWHDGGPEYDHLNYITGTAPGGDVLIVQHSTDYPYPKSYANYFSPRAHHDNPHLQRFVLRIDHTGANIT